MGGAFRSGPRKEYVSIPVSGGASRRAATRGAQVAAAKNVSVYDAADALPTVSADQVVVEEGTGVPGATGGVSLPQKVKGVAQMAGGAALVAAGVPMCVLPGPGVATIAGGAALASKGQRNFTGREATPIEAKLDEVAEKLGSAAKEQVSKAAHTAVEKAPEAASKAAHAVAENAPKVAKAAARATPVVARQVAKAAKAGGRLAVRGVGAVASHAKERRRKAGDSKNTSGSKKASSKKASGPEA